jgi:NADH-quinone oxidoreductase subunit N
VLIVSSTIGLVYYLRVIVAMFTESERPLTEGERGRIGFTPIVALAALTLALFALGVYPGPLWDAIREATAALG